MENANRGSMNEKKQKTGFELSLEGEQEFPVTKFFKVKCFQDDIKESGEITIKVANDSGTNSN